MVQRPDPTELIAEGFRLCNQGLQDRADADANYSRGCELCVRAMKLESRANDFEARGGVHDIEHRDRAKAMREEARAVGREGNKLKAEAIRLWEQSIQKLRDGFQKIAEAD